MDKKSGSQTLADDVVNQFLQLHLEVRYWQLPDGPGHTKDNEGSDRAITRSCSGSFLFFSLKIVILNIVEV